MARRQRWGSRALLLIAGVLGCQPGTLSDGLAPAKAGSLSVIISGLPAGALPGVSVTGPGGFAKSLTSSQVLSGLAPGTYSVAAGAVLHQGNQWEAAAATQFGVVSAGQTATTSVAYSATTGSLRVSLGGLPPGAPASVLVSGPNGFSTLLLAGTTLTGLAPGGYEVVASPIEHGGELFQPATPVQQAVVQAGAELVTVDVGYTQTTGRLTVTFGGVPTGGAAQVEITGPGGFELTLGAGTTVVGLEPGNYTIAATGFVVDAVGWGPVPGSQVVAVSASPVAASASVLWVPVTAGLSITTAGLPGGMAAAITVSGPGGFERAVTSSEVLTGLAPGGYTVVATPIASAGLTWNPTPASQQVTLVAGATTSAGVAWSLQAGSLAVTIGGLPGGAAAAVTVSGPQGFTAALTGSQLLANLLPGSYTVVAEPVSPGGVPWNPVPTSQVINVVSGAAAATVTYTQGTGGLALTVTGLPTAVANIAITGPGSFAASPTGSQSWTGLLPGSYQVTASAVVIAGTTYQPTPISQAATVVAGGSATAAVSYVATTGSLAVTINGLPGGGNASVTVSGPGGASHLLTASQTLTGLAPGSWTVAAANVTSGPNSYAPTPATQVANVVAGSSANAAVTYAVTTGSLVVTISGLPGGAPAAVTVSGPGGASHALTSSQTLTGLAAGSWTITATTVTSGPDSYAPTPASQVRTVTAGGSASATVTYAIATGSLAVTISGLPGGVDASVTVSGPGGANHALTASQTLTGLATGSWTVTGAVVTSGANSYSASPSTQVATVPAGGTANVTVTYSLVPVTSLNLRIDGAYLTQAVQRLDHGVELVAGRDAYLRVFVVANEANTATPQVRARLYHGGTEVQSWLINAGAGSVTQTVSEGTLTSSWNVLVPGALIVPGARILAEVDPGGAIVEQDESDNFYPANAVPMAVAVRTLLPFQIRLVPVLQSVNGLQGNADSSNMDGYLTSLKKMLPIGTYDVDVRAAYTTNAPVLQSSNGNGAWGTILSEVLALRNATDASTRYYYGVVKTSYSSGIAGMGYVPFSPTSTSKAAIGWDFSGSRARILAHELGHNFGRSHAPCGGAGGPDPSYPHTGGQIGAWGLDVATLAVKAPTTFFDLMGYCPPNEWVSDYTWNAVLNYRSGSPTGAPMAAGGGGPDDGLLVWGRITPSGVVLEPAFRVAPTAQAAPARGAWRVEARNASGALLFSQSFAPQEVADLPGGAEQHFAMVLPMGSAVLDRVASLQVVGPGGGSTRAPAASAEPTAMPVVRALATGRRQVTWDASRHPMALVRDAATGEILSFARGGAITLWSGAGQLDVQLSDGVRVVRTRVGVQ